MTSAVTANQGESVEEADFRVRARRFLGEHAPRRSAQADAEDEDPLHGPDEGGLKAAHSYQAALFDAGLAGLTWPRDYGGQGLSSRYQTIFNEEVPEFDPPNLIYTIGFGMCIPTVLAHG